MAEWRLSAFFFFFQAEDGIRDYWRDWSSDVCSSDLAGFMSQGLTNQILHSVPGMHVVAISNRWVERAVSVFRYAGYDDVVVADSQRELDDAAIRLQPRSEERRVGKECRSRWSPYH